MVNLRVTNEKEEEYEDEEPLTEEEQTRAQIEEIRRDLNNAFPFAALWQDEIQTGWEKLIPMISMIILIIMLVLNILILAKK